MSGTLFAPNGEKSFELIELAGDPGEIGQRHGEVLKPDILANLDLLLDRSGLGQKLDGSLAYRRWIDRQVRFNDRLFPGAIAEIEAVSRGSGVPLARLFDLAFCTGWEYFEQDAPAAPGPTCSILVITAKSGEVICASTLDDPPEIWPCPVRFVPSTGASFITTVWPGTSWAGRGMNSAGLCLNTAGLGIRKLDRGWYRDRDVVNMGFACRAILAGCTLVDDVRRFCRDHLFTMNLACVDRNGGIFAAHQTEEGPVEVGGNGAATLTNTVGDDALCDGFARAGYTLYPEHPTSRYRNGRLRAFALERANATDREEVAALFSARQAGDRGAICHDLTAWITLAAPGSEPGAYWMKRPNGPGTGPRFARLAP